MLAVALNLDREDRRSESRGHPVCDCKSLVTYHLLRETGFEIGGESLWRGV